MSTAKNKDISTTSGTVDSIVNREIFRHFSSASIIDFEQVNVCWSELYCLFLLFLHYLHAGKDYYIHLTHEI